MVGLWQSYKRLPRKQRIIMGLFGMTVGLFGPQVMSLLMQVEEENKGETVEIKTKMES